MNSRVLSRNKLVTPLGETFGSEVAEKMVDDAATAAGLPLLAAYPEHEFLKIVAELKKSGGLVKIMATTIETRLILKKLV